MARRAEADHDEEESVTKNLLGVAGRVAITGPQGILLLRRSASSELDPSRWELPGGKLNWGQPLTRALTREVHEEPGLTVEVGRPLLIWHLHKALSG